MAADKGWSFVAFETPGRGEPSKDGLSVPPLGPYLYPTAHEKTAPVLSIPGPLNVTQSKMFLTSFTLDYRSRRPSAGVPGTRISALIPYLMAIMSKAFDFCVPTRGTKVPHTPDWIHEIKYDGYRLRIERDGDRVRLITRNGYDWIKRFPGLSSPR
jgi:hypothetical protein